MYGWEPRVLLKHYLEQGLSKTAIADLNAQALHWLATVANVRIHGTTKEQPILRFERDERALLKSLAPRPYRSLVLLPDAATAAKPVRPVPRVSVARRPLTAYAELAGGAQ